MLNCIPANIFIVSIDASTPPHPPPQPPPPQKKTKNEKEDWNKWKKEIHQI